MRLQLRRRVNIINFVGNLEQMIGTPEKRFYGAIGPSNEFPIIIGVKKGYPADPEIYYVVIAHNATNRHVPYQGDASKFDILGDKITTTVIEELRRWYESPQIIT